MTTKNLPSSDPDVLDEETPTFDALSLSREVRQAVDELGYTHPTPVQCAVFESAAARRDIVVQARTGTGKTAAFGLPVVDRLVDLSAKEAQVLILSPTRELALQINREIENLAKHKGVACTAVYGGAAMQPQIDAIRRGAQVIAGTPGRVLDHLERGTLNPKTIHALVLDESDEMLSMGFLPQITKVMELLPKKHQTLLFSATLPADVRRIAETRLTDPEFITLSGDHIGALSIDHYVYRSTGNKSEELVQILDIENPESAIIFCNTRDQTKRISAALNQKGYASDWLNADLAQNDREKVMRATREGKLRFLVCTDVAARGIDISHLTHVINADFPPSTENYVHRTGRTGRAGNTGTAISLIAPQDVGNLYMLRLTYKIFPVERELPSQGDVQTRKEADLVNFLYKAFASESLTAGDRSLARRVLSSDTAEVIVAGLLRDHLGGHPTADKVAASDRRKGTVRNPASASNDQANSASAASPHAGKRSTSKPKQETTRRTEKPDRTEKDVPERPPKTPSKQPSVRNARSESAQQLKSETPQGKKLEGSSATLPPRERKERTPRREAAPKRARASASSNHDNLTDGLEVISASALLDASENAVLRGETPPPASPARQTRERIEKDKDNSRRPKTDDSDLARIFVDAGKRDDLCKDDFLDNLEDGGLMPKDIVFVTIRDTHSFLGVNPERVAKALAALNDNDLGGLRVRAEKARPRRD